MPDSMPALTAGKRDQLFADLRRIVGVRKAKRLLPQFAQTAAIFGPSETETLHQRRAAKAHVAQHVATEKEIAQLLRRLDALRGLIPEAAQNGYLPDTSEGDPAEAVVRRTLDAAVESVRMVTNGREWRELVYAWRDAARFAMRGKRGRKIGDRRRLAEWVARQLAREGVALKKNANGTLAMVLTSMYEASGIKAPEDLYADVCCAIDYFRSDGMNLH